MKLYATAQPNNTVAKTLEVYDDEGRAFIRKTLLTGRVIEWRSPDRTAAEWIELSSNPRRKWRWALV